MRKILAFVLVLSLVFAFSAVVGATTWLDQDEESGTVTLNINSVVYINVLESKTQEGSGFAEGEIRNGWAQWKALNRVQVHSTTDYIVAANLNEGSFKFEEDSFTDNYDPAEKITDDVARARVANNGPTSGNWAHNWKILYAKADPYNDASGSLLAVDTNDVRADQPYSDIVGSPASPADWHLLDGNGFYENHNPGTFNATFEMLFEGGPTMNNPAGDKCKIDFGFDLGWVQESDDIAELPSGIYTMDVDYLVMEQ